MVAAAIIGSAVVGGGVSAYASKQAANAQANAAQQSVNTQEGMFNTVNQQQAPWRQAGQASLGEIAGMGDYFNHQFSPADLTANLAPNYAFMLNQGQQATTNQANAMGGLGGNSLKAINDYTQNYAQNAYQQAFQNYSGQRTDIFNRLAAIAGLGQTAGTAAATGAPSFAQSIGQSLGNIGQAQASGIVGQANALTGAANNAMGWYQLSNFMNPNAAGGVYSGGNPGGP